MQGLEQSFFPLGEAMAYAFARKGSAFWLLSFAFALGFGTTVADPALIAVINEAAKSPVMPMLLNKTVMQNCITRWDCGSPSLFQWAWRLSLVCYALFGVGRYRIC
jgi:hypothetical protein